MADSKNAACAGPPPLKTRAQMVRDGDLARTSQLSNQSDGYTSEQHRRGLEQLKQHRHSCEEHQQPLPHQTVISHRAEELLELVRMYHNQTVGARRSRPAA